MAALHNLPDVGEQLRPLIEALPIALQPRILARLERGAAERYRAWAAECPDAQQADGLRACEGREEEIATRVERALPQHPDEQAQLSAALPAIVGVYRAAFAQRPIVEQYAMQAAAERRGAAVWRMLVPALFAGDATVRAVLLSCAELEERNAEFLEAVVRQND